MSVQLIRISFRTSVVNNQANDAFLNGSEFRDSIHPRVEPSASTLIFRSMLRPESPRPDACDAPIVCPHHNFDGLPAGVHTFLRISGALVVN